MSIKLGPGFKLTPEGKIEADEAARLAKLPVNKRIASRKKQRTASPSRARDLTESDR